VLDGRVDNRDELRAAVEVRGARVRTSSDAELVLQAYHCWGDSCPGYIVGDFAFVIWDRRHRCIFCARDPLGVRPFYYYSDHRTFVCCSELHALFQHKNVRREPNEGMIGEHLAIAISHREETLFRGVLRLPAGHCLSVHRSGIRTAQYWNLNPARTIRYRTDGDYAEHFGSIFSAAVRCRLRAQGPVGAELSGGLDSSSVVSVVQALRQNEAASAGFETFSMTFPGLSCDEAGYIEEVVSDSRATSNISRGGQTTGASLWSQLAQYQDLPDYPNAALFYPLRALARQKGIRVLLTGVGGDEWLDGSYYQYADLLRRGRLIAFVRQLRHGSPDRMLGSAMRFGIWPLMPARVRSTLRWILRRDPVPRWINRQFARRHSLRERLRQNTIGATFANLSQQGVFLSATSAWQSHMLEMEDRTAASFGLEERHPFLDRRIAEFALAIPEEQRWRGRYPKYVLRQAMKGLLPESVRTRTTKADFSHAFADVLTTLGSRGFFDHLAIEAMQWVDGGRIRLMYDELARLYARHDNRYLAWTWPLWMVVGIECWFRTTFLVDRSYERPVALLELASGARWKESRL